MRRLTVSVLKGILILLFLGTGLLLLSLLIKWLRPLSLAVLLIGLILMFRFCRCPTCGTSHTIERLLYAVYHPLYCRHCGQRIRIHSDPPDSPS